MTKPKNCSKFLQLQMQLRPPFLRTLNATVISVHAGGESDLDKPEQRSITVELDGIVGDRHRGHTRKTWVADKQPKGTLRRNERHWSAVSDEELTEITRAMDLRYPLLPSTLGANLCIQGVEEFSRLPKGTLLRFPSGAELSVEEYNPPCHEMGEKLAATNETLSGEPLSSTAFSNAARLLRGLVGIVEVPGDIFPGDEVEIVLYEHPGWLERSAG